MAELREVFEMATKQVEPDQDAWREQEQRQRRISRRRKWGAVAVAALIAGALAVAVVTNVQDEGTTPATEPIVPTKQGLYAVNVDTGGLAEFTDPGDGTFGFAVSPDGTQTAYVGSVVGVNQLFVMNTDGTDQRLLTDHRLGAADPAWSPDGSRIAYTAGGEGSGTDIFVYDVQAGTTAQLTREKGEAQLPAWSYPDGDSIAFTTVGKHLRASLNIIDLVTGETAPLFLEDRDVWGAQWSPDGSQIAYVKRPEFDGSEREIWIVNADGTGAHRLATSGNEFVRPMWSPDGSRIAWVDTEGQSFVTNLVDPDTGASQVGTIGWAEAWLDDHRLIVGISDEDIAAAGG